MSDEPPGLVSAGSSCSRPCEPFGKDPGAGSFVFGQAGDESIKGAGFGGGELLVGEAKGSCEHSTVHF